MDLICFGFKLKHLLNEPYFHNSKKCIKVLGMNNFLNASGTIL